MDVSAYFNIHKFLLFSFSLLQKYIFSQNCLMFCTCNAISPSRTLDHAINPCKNKFFLKAFTEHKLNHIYNQ